MYRDIFKKLKEKNKHENRRFANG